MSDLENTLLSALVKGLAAQAAPEPTKEAAAPVLGAIRRSPGFLERAMPHLIEARQAMRPIKARTPGIAVEYDRDTRQTTRRGYFYADLAEILAVVMEPLLDAGFMLTQSPARLGQGDVLITELLHAGTGEWMASYVPIRLNPEKPQEQAASITSARRAAIPALLGLAAEAAGKTEVEWHDGGEIRSAGVDPASGEEWDGAMAISDGPAPFDGGEPVNGVSRPEIPEKPEDRPAPPPPLDLDFNRPGNRKVALAGLRKVLATGDSLAAQEAWAITYSLLVAKLPAEELQIAVDDYRRKVGGDPPPVAGVEYPPAPPAPGGANA